MLPIQADLIGTDIITSSTEADEMTAMQNSIEICVQCHTELNAFSIDEECPGNDESKEV